MKSASTSSPPGLFSGRRRWAVAVALVLVVLLLNLVRLSQFRSPWLSIPASGPSAPRRLPSAHNCSMDALHRDPLFLAQAECVPQANVVAVLRELVLTAVELFETHNVTYFLDSGTLLGAYRNQRVIAYDTDADLAIDEPGFDYIRSRQVAVREPFVLMVYASGDLYPGSQRDKGIPIRLVHKPTALYTDVFVFQTQRVNGSEMVGPFPSWAFDKCKNCTDYYSEGKQLLVPRAWIYPTVSCSFEGRELQCPRETEKYLRYMFGDDFMTPIQY